MGLHSVVVGTRNQNRGTKFFIIKSKEGPITAPWCADLNMLNQSFMLAELNELKH